MFQSIQIPRPEYPRPERQRGRVEGIDWLNLNGPWEFRFDYKRIGIEREWYVPRRDSWEDQIIVPFCWESLAAWGAGDGAGNDHYYSTRCFVNAYEVTHENHRTAERYEVGWYRREIAVPTDGPWKDRQVILTIGAADFFTDGWCNGLPLGRHDGGYDPFEFDLTEALGAPGPDGMRRGLLVLRIEDPMDHADQPVGKQWGWYTTTSGIWQTVFVEPRSITHIDSFRIVPDIDQRLAAIEIACRHAGEASRVTVQIIPPAAPAFRLETSVVADQATIIAGINPVALWEPGDPQLYQIEFQLFDPSGKLLDEVRGYFGMRKISTAPAEDAPAILCLNNQPIYLRGALYQSYFPEGVYTAPSAGVLRDDIKYALAAGFDFLRVHIKLDDPLLLYYADTLGIMLMQDFPNFGEGGDTPLGRRRFEAMLKAGIKRDFNHPSIVAWCIFNETWGFGGQSELMKLITPRLPATGAPGRSEAIDHTPSFRWIHEVWLLAKELDPTRLIEDMSVVMWEHLPAYGHVETDINSWHFYINDYPKARDHITKVVGSTYHGSPFNYIEGYTQRNVPLISSEYGGCGALDPDQDISWSFKFLTNELRRHGQISAYIFTQLMDVEWEHNGMLNYDRTPKSFGYHPSLINRGDVLPIDSAPISLQREGDTIEVEVLSSHFSRRRRPQVSLHWRYSGMDTLAKFYPDLARGSEEIEFRHHHVGLARLLKLDLPQEPMLCSLAVSAVTPDGEVIASNFIQHLVSNGPPREREERKNLLILRRKVSDWKSALWSNGHSDRAEANRDSKCCGGGAGRFEWEFHDEAFRSLGRAARLTFLIEASSAREGIRQTATLRHPSRLDISINGRLLSSALLPDHPHDTRGALSFLKGGNGAYGYLHRVTLEHDLLDEVASTVESTGRISIETAVVHSPTGGLVVYDYDSGRFPVAPTLIIHWPNS
ncbi:glycoside hydrolase family 2 [Luteolibacter sp. GHJ8]|uniref:Glycoside hydrolase family 2 n=1 Tax=Luteolibacter rhizosphaerae TaxID=2989719 RepID=A0ABT3FZE0_9BACT|nr:sugar-binding domain-containing protein [Luteolibacter rhizosphaerae]MCW1912953.1 glycoside hydrolase family 2 [Luteolibacter rhizosphaerae]